MSRVVDVTYRGLRVAQRVHLAETAAEQGFVEVDAPLPVGTRVMIVGEGSFTADALVTGVVEQETGGKATAGMRVDWRPSKAATTLELDPETDALPEPEAEPEAEAEAEAEAEPEPEADAAAGSPPVAVEDAGTSSPPTSEGDGSSRGRRRKKKNPVGRP